MKNTATNKSQSHQSQNPAVLTGVGFAVTGFIVGVGVTGGGATEVHHLPKQPASHWSLLVLHQSPPWAPPSQVELAAIPSVPLQIL